MSSTDTPLTLALLLAECRTTRSSACSRAISACMTLQDFFSAVFSC